MKRNQLDLSLYLVVGQHDVDERGVEAIVRAAVDGGVSLVQLREKELPTREFIRRARSLRDSLNGTNVPLVINDRVDVALACDTDGVHIGQDDMNAADARRLLGPNAIVGVTVHNEEEIEAAARIDVDYLSIGGVFVTQSKDNTGAPVGLEGLSQLAAYAHSICDLPLAAIAGIGEQTAADVIRCGVDGVAVISAIVADKDPSAAAGRLLKIVHAARAT